MNIYVCSTVRHLLFSLLKAITEPGEKHHILFFYDYQQVSLADWDFDHLPENIRVYNLSRERFTADLKATAGGHLFYRMAMRSLPAPGFLKKGLHRLLERDCTELASELAAGQKPQLWAFYERNRMARVFRMLTPTFAIIEDGEGNYRLLECPLWKRPARLFMGLPLRWRAYGEAYRCREIWVLNPEKLPLQVRHKGRRIEYLHSPAARRTLEQIFGSAFSSVSGPDTMLIATQPIDGLNAVSKTDKERMYAQIADHLLRLDRRVALKIHPKEDVADYENLAKRIPLAPNKIPIEALVVGADSPITIVTLTSTAGMGYEDYCTRVRLCDGVYEQVVPKWAAHPELLDEALHNALPLGTVNPAS